jgi:hypothetical protein
MNTGGRTYRRKWVSAAGGLPDQRQLRDGYPADRVRAFMKSFA